MVLVNAVSGQQTIHAARPLMTVDEVARAPRSLDIGHFLPDGETTEDQLSVVRTEIIRGSWMVTNYCHQPLHACVDTQARRVPVDRWGKVAIPTRHNPIRQVLSVELGNGPNDLQPVDLTYVEIDDWRIRIPWGWAGGEGPYARWSYIAGWVVTWLTAPVEEGATSIVVDDATGIVPGHTVLTLTDGPAAETVVAGAVTGNTVTVPALTADHAAGVGVSELPDDVKQALLNMLDAGLRFCDSHSLTMIRQDRTIGPEQDQRASMLDTARSLLNDYMRVI